MRVLMGLSGAVRVDLRVVVVGLLGSMAWVARAAVVRWWRLVLGVLMALSGGHGRLLLRVEALRRRVGATFSRTSAESLHVLRRS